MIVGGRSMLFVMCMFHTVDDVGGVAKCYDMSRFVSAGVKSR